MDMPIRQFIRSSLRLVNPSNPTMPLHGDDMAIGIDTLNILLSSYSSSGLLLPIAQTHTLPINNGDKEIIIGPAGYTPTPDIVAGRMSNFNEAWLDLNGVTYPLIDIQRQDYLSSYKYEPLSGLPCYLVIFQENLVTRLRLYPAPSQFYNFNIRGKFQIRQLTSNDNMNVLPDYMIMYLKYAVAKQWAFEMGRSDAWTDPLESELRALRKDIEASSEVNLSLRRTSSDKVMLNGAAIARAGV